jgi:hypothetical protein
MRSVADATTRVFASGLREIGAEAHRDVMKSLSGPSALYGIWRNWRTITASDLGRSITEGLGVSPFMKIRHGASIARAAHRLLVAGTTATLLASLLVVGAAPLAAAATVDHFAFTAIGNQTAGQSFTVTVTAFGPGGNPLPGYAGGAVLSGNLGTSPACSSCAHGSTPASYGAFGTWVGGSATASVTGYLAETGVSLTVTDGTTQNTSNTFDVLRAAAAHVDFADAAISFDGQPTTTKKGTPIYSYCAPGGSPCGVGSLPVAAIVRDDNGNAEPGLTVTLTAYQNPGTGFTGTASGSTGTDGKVSFGSPNPLLITPSTATGTARLRATVTSGPVNDSSTFQIVDDLESCTGSTCDNLATTSTGDAQEAYGKVTTGGGALAPATTGALAGVTLITQFQDPTSHCVGATTSQVGKTTDVHVELESGATTQLAFQVALIIPKTVLQLDGIASRSVGSFNVCFGATDLSGSATTGWTQKKLVKSGPSTATLDGGLWWGWLADCTVKKVTNSPPCISLRTKNAGELQAALGLSSADFAALNFSSGDLAIVYRTAYPWDAKGSIF